MDSHLTTIAQRCLAAAHAGTLDFPGVVRTLMEAGFEGYDVDFRRGRATYFVPSGDAVELPLPEGGGGVAAEFKPGVVEEAVREAQRKAPGYTYEGFCAKVKAAGCAGYMASFSGRRVVYFGRTAETHVEHFPK
jgi:uncharacterized protein YbcV (DUF1398 family)